MNTILNPYQIFWGIVELESKANQNQAKSLNSASVTGSASKDRNWFFFHAPASKIEERTESILSQLQASNLHGKIYRINDKQYGMMVNTYNGTIPEAPKPFKQVVILRNGNSISAVPVTEEQMNKTLIF